MYNIKATSFVEQTIYKQRMIVRTLMDFIEQDDEYNIAVVTGIRRIGKTVALKQLQMKYDNAVYIDFSKKEALQQYIEFSTNGTAKLLLIDEVSLYPDYVDLVTEIMEMSFRKQFKVILTGSSPTHLLSISSGTLGGRARLFRMSLINFTEYLYFTEVISSYNDSSYQPTSEDFGNYLQLKHLDRGLRIVFDMQYFKDFYSDIELSNRNSTLVRDDINITETELVSLCDLLAYKLYARVKYETFANPDVGTRELGIALKQSTNLAETFLNESVVHTRSITPQSKARILYFLLKSGMAYVDISYEHKAEYDYSDLLNVLTKVRQGRDLVEIFKAYAICIVNPLIYTRLAKDILRKADLTIDDSILNDNNNSLLGAIVETYVKGQYAHYGNSLILNTNKIGEGTEEVDLIDDAQGVLCECTVSDDKRGNIHLNKYLKDVPTIRVLSTKSKADRVNGYHRIPYPKLCNLIDTGELFHLDRT